MVRGSTLFLKTAVILIGIPVLAMCIFLVPEIANYMGDVYPDMAYLKYWVYINFYGSAIPFYFALYQAFLLLNFIDNNSAFSLSSVNALKKIRTCAILISLIHLAGLPLYYLIAQSEDAPGIIIIGLILAFASLVIAVFAAVLGKLLQEAIRIKTENDLTV